MKVWIVLSVLLLAGLVSAVAPAQQPAEKPYEKLGHEIKVEEGSRLSAELKLIPTGEPPR